MSITFVLDEDEINQLELRIVAEGNQYSRPDLRRELGVLGHLVRPDIIVFIHIHLLGRGRDNVAARGFFAETEVAVSSEVLGKDYEYTLIHLFWPRPVDP